MNFNSAKSKYIFGHIWQCLMLTHGRLGGPYEVLGIEPGLATYQVSILSAPAPKVDFNSKTEHFIFYIIFVFNIFLFWLFCCNVFSPMSILLYFLDVIPFGTMFRITNQFSHIYLLGPMINYHEKAFISLWSVFLKTFLIVFLVLYFHIRWNQVP